MPIIPVFDLEFNPSNRRIYAGTFGRSMQSYPVDSLTDTEKNPVKTVKPEQPTIRIFPNPTADFIELGGVDLKGVEILLFDSEGRKVYSSKWDPQDKRLRMDSHSPGVYFLQLQWPSGKTVTWKVLKI